MNSTFRLLCIAFLLGSIARADEVFFQDDFGGLDGFVSTNTNDSYEDSYEQRMREAHSYMSGEIEDGELVLVVTEGKKTKGPDGKPGVLSLSFSKLPKSVAYSGFTYLGASNREISIPKKAVASKETLGKIRVSFKHKAVNKKPANTGMAVNCRFEIDVDNAFASRIDFGKLESTKEWQTFEMTLDKGTNHDAFLATVKNLNYPSFKFAWSQIGKIDSYQDGDTLLIDDIKISSVK